MKIGLAFIFLTIFAFGFDRTDTAGSPPPRSKSFLHVVYVWLKPDLERKDIEEFEQDMRALRKIKTVKKMQTGKPAGTQRDVVDNTYSYVIVIYFDDARGHDLYQNDPIHRQFVEKHKSKWTRIQVYDALLE